MMTGRERVKATLTFKKPDRPPRDLWTLPYVLLFRQDELDDGSGGVIAQCEWGRDNSKENIEAVFQSWSEPIPGI